MALSAGTRLGPYEIVGAIGAGGMGEVYRARDHRLDRDVAVKILPAAVAADSDRLARFEREARALAAVSHPNIGAIFGVEQVDSRPALVLELVEGPTLADLIAHAPNDRAGSGGLALADALPLAVQIADALEAAHDKGIIHRDLKPANIKVTARGTVKVLDFGLAKAESSRREGAAQDEETRALETASGTVLGTPRYMSPEQARGEAVGAQADVWSFGCVLFEMLAGRAAFEGHTVADTLAAVIEREPEWALLPAATPFIVRRLLRRCLRKDVRERLRHIGDARLDLDEALRRGDDALEPAGRVKGVDLSGVDLRRVTDSVGLKENPALSPDGKMIAFTAVTGGKRQIWIQLVAGGAPLQVTRDPFDHDEPRWAPDSSRLIFHAPAKVAGAMGSIWEISALGGTPRRIAEALGNGDLSHDGTRLAHFRRSGDRVELAIAALDGSDSRVVAEYPSGTMTYTVPRWSPDDQAVAFARANFSQFETRVLVVPIGGGEAACVARADWIRGHAWRPDGSGLVYSASTGNTMPYPPLHNLRTVDRDGRADRPLTFGDVSYLEPDVRAPGHVVAARARSRSDVWMFPIAGSPQENTRQATRLTHQTGQVQTPSVSPDGSEFVYVSDHGGHSNLWVAAVDGSSVRQITFERDPETIVGVAHWSPRGDRIVFITARHGQIGLRVIAPDGSGLRPLLAPAFSASWSGDGRWVYHMQPDGNVYKIDVDDGTVVLVRSNAAAPTVTPDGRALYFVTRAIGDRRGARAEWELHRSEPEDGPSTSIGLIDGARLPFSPRFTPHLSLSPDGTWLAAPLTDGETTNLWLFPTGGGAPRQVTDFGTRPTLIARWAPWTPDGQHLLAAVAETDVDIVWIGGLL